MDTAKNWEKTNNSSFNIVSFYHGNTRIGCRMLFTWTVGSIDSLFGNVFHNFYSDSVWVYTEFRQGSCSFVPRCPFVSVDPGLHARVNNTCTLAQYNKSEGRLVVKNFTLVLLVYSPTITLTCLLEGNMLLAIQRYVACGDILIEK